MQSKPSLSLTAVGLLLAAGILTLAAWLMSLAWSSFTYHAALAGTPGTLTAAHCFTVGSGKSTHRECTGTFVAQNGRYTDASAHAYEVRDTGSSPIRLQLRSDGGYTQPNPPRAAIVLAVLLGIVSGAALLLLFLCAMPQRVSVDKGVPLRANPQPWGVLLLILSWLSAGAALAAVASFAMFFVLLVAGLFF
ncbi:hypothetical protein GCM10010211_81850 [Streptomyces albospinus]|uniref:DUF3592 domain-containing protein n=1 Tax=Streptomyces albospinus TaxID=285515 RepID=A0ABQ2VP79_9ACTN|nr:hypothetical protein [Streptomyces albospinus]GGV02122.1 hypothetical protein GCM10010211_81850 [Streptomyces albospinus]